jgi:hypothetical protein
LVAGGVEGVGHAVVLAGLPDDRVGVVLAAVMHGQPHPEREGGFAVPDRLAAVVAALVGGDPELVVQPVEDPLALADGIPGELGVGVGELVGQVGVVVAVAGVQVAAEAVGDVVGWPLAELVTAEGGWGLQVFKQLAVLLAELAVLRGPVQAWSSAPGGV